MLVVPAMVLRRVANVYIPAKKSDSGKKIDARVAAAVDDRLPDATPKRGQEVLMGVRAVLANTELPLMIRPGETSAIVFDSMAIHAAKAVFWALADRL